MISKIIPSSRPIFPAGDPRRYPTVQHDEVRTDTLSRIVRSPRTGNKLADFKNDIEGIARFINGIALQMGLTSGDAKVDDVIRELLRMGSVTVDQLLNIQQQDVTAAIDKYKALTSELKVDGDITNTEKGAILRENIRLEIKDFGDVSDNSGATEYMKKLDGILKLNIDSKIVQKHSQNVIDVVNILRKVEDYNDKKLVSDPHQEILETTKRLMKVDNDSAQFIEVLSSLDTLIKIDVAPTFLDPFLDVYNNQQKYKNEPLLKGAPKKDAVAANLNALKNSVSIFKTSEVPFSHLKDIVTIRNSGSTQPLVHVAGFPNGVKDLVMLKTDVGAEWLRNAVNGTEGISEQLLQAFEPIDNFTTALDTVESAWQSSDASGAVEKIQNMFREVQWLATEHDITATLVNATDHKCLANSAEIGESGILDAHRKMVQLHGTLQGLSFVKTWDEIKARLDPLKNEFAYEGTADATKTQEMVEKLQKSESVKTAIVFFDQLATTLKTFHTFLQDKTLVNDIKASQSITTFMREVQTSSHLDFLKCMSEGIGTGGEAMKRTFEIIQNIRDNGTKNLSFDAFEIVKAVLDSMGDIVKAKTAGLAIKGVKNEEMEKVMAAMGKEKLKELMDMFKAVRGMDTILKLDEMKPLLGDLTFIVGQAEKAKLSKDDVDRLKDMQKTMTEMYTGIDKVVNSIKQDPENLKDLGQVFEEAAKMKSVTLDIKKLIESLEKLEKVMKKGQTGKGVQKRAANNLSDVISALKTLAPLNLDFAGYNFNAATKAMSSLNTFFVGYVPPSNTGGLPGAQSFPVPSARPGVTAMAQLASSSTQLASLAPADNPWIYGGIGIVIVSAIIIAIGVYCCKKKKGSSDSKKPLPSNKPVDGKDNGEGEKKDKGKDAGNEEEKEEECPKQKVEDEPEKKNEKKTVEPKEKKPEEPKVPEPVEEKKVVPPVVPLLPNDRPEKSTQSISDRSIVGTDKGTDILAEDKSFTMIKAARDSLTAGAKDKELPRSALYFSEDILYRAGQTERFEGDIDVCTRETRHGIACKEETMVKITGFQNNFIHANEMVIDNITWIMAQGPLEDDRPALKIDTREKHWAMIDQQNVGICVQLCQFVENDKVKCSRYYPENLNEEMTFGRYKVKCVGFVNVDHFTDLKHINVPKLKYTNTQTGMEKFVDIMLYDSWPDHGVPKSLDVAAEIIELCDSYNKSVLVHCSAGVGRTGTLVGFRKGIELFSKNELMSVEQIVCEVRAHRYNAIQNGSQVIYLILVVARYFMKKRNIPHSDIFNEVLYYKENYADYENNYINCPELENNKKRQYDDKNTPSTPEELARSMNAWRGPEYERLQKDLVKREAFVARKRAEYEAKKGKQQKEAGIKTSKDKSEKSLTKSKRSQKTKSTQKNLKKSVGKSEKSKSKKEKK